jgi:hypothetical protein
MRLKIVPPEGFGKDGPMMATGFHVIDAETGRELTGVRSIKWEAKAGDVVRVTVELMELQPGELEGEGNVQHVCSECNQRLNIIARVGNATPSIAVFERAEAGRGGRALVVTHGGACGF